MLYFAYGSNMSSARLRARVPCASFVAVARLGSHRLEFHKIGLDGSAKCDAAATRRAADEVLGAVLELREADLSTLDTIEGVGRGYERRRVEVETVEGRRMSAWVYEATRTAPELRPFRWYRRHVLEGARELGLPRGYRAAIRAVAAVDDPDSARAARELSIHRSAAGHGFG